MENHDCLRDTLLVCDCRAHEPCHGDFLASATPPTACATKRRGPQASSHEGSKRGNILDSCSVAGTWAGDATLYGDTIPNSVRFPQQCLKRAVVQMFLPDWVTDAPFSFVEDLVKGLPFTDYGECFDAQDYDVDGAQAPIIGTRMPRGPRLAGEGICPRPSRLIVSALSASSPTPHRQRVARKLLELVSYCSRRSGRLRRPTCHASTHVRRCHTLPPQSPPTTCSHLLHQRLHANARTCPVYASSPTTSYHCGKRWPPRSENGQVSACFLLTLCPIRKSLCSSWSPRACCLLGLAAITTEVILGRAWMQQFMLLDSLTTASSCICRAR